MPSDPDDPTTRPTRRTVTAKDRLTAVNAHLRKHTPLDEQNATDWLSKAEELELRRELARIAVEDDRGQLRQKAEGKLWVRERIELLLNPGSFREVGSLTSSVTYSPDSTQITDFVPSNNLIGTGTIGAAPLTKKVVVLADDFTVRGGHADGSVHHKSAWAEESALRLRCPMIRLLDGSSGGGSVKSYLEMGRTYVPPLTGFKTMVDLLANVPVCAALLGPVVGLAAIKATVTHFNVMVQGKSQLFSAGPPVVKYATFENLTKNELGGSKIHSINGSVDNLVASEPAAFAQIVQFLSYLPSSTSLLPPLLPVSDPTSRRPEELLSIIPRKRTRTYDVRRVIELIVDEGTWFEIGRTWGKSIVVGLGRLGGKSVGIVSQDCKEKGGTLDERSAQKVRRHIDLCETFGLPILNLVDQPGISVGTAAERDATVRASTNALVALFQATVPAYTVILRRAFGVAGAGFVDFAAPANYRVAWPSGDWGSLPLQGGVEAAFKAELDVAKSPEERKVLLAKLTQTLEAIRSPLRTAEAFGIEEIIDPRDTRVLACEWIAHAYEHVLPDRLVKRQAMEAMGGARGGYRP